MKQTNSGIYGLVLFDSSSYAICFGLVTWHLTHSPFQLLLEPQLKTFQQGWNFYQEQSLLPHATIAPMQTLLPPTPLPPHAPESQPLSPGSFKEIISNILRHLCKHTAETGTFRTAGPISSCDWATFIPPHALWLALASLSYWALPPESLAAVGGCFICLMQCVLWS